MTLLNDRFAPITSAIGFIEAPLTKASGALRSWRASIHGSADTEQLVGGLEENVLRLEPLTVGYFPRELLVATQNSEWTAVFGCGSDGGDPDPTISFLAQSIGCRGLTVVSVPEAPPEAGRPWGALQFSLYGPVPNPILNYLRSISLIQDGSKWEFVTGQQQPLDFEDVEMYSNRKVRDRFTLEMLTKYCASLGLYPFDPTFYTGPSVLVTNASSRMNPIGEFTLDQVQRKLGVGYTSHG